MDTFAHIKIKNSYRIMFTRKHTIIFFESSWKCMNGPGPFIHSWTVHQIETFHVSKLYMHLYTPNLIINAQLGVGGGGKSLIRMSY